MSLTVENLSFSYGSHRVLQGVSFAAQPGDLLCVLGPNGVGKSTLFRCMLGLQGRFTGRITIGGEDVQKLSPGVLAKKIAYIPQASSPTFDYSVFHTVLMGTTAQLSTLSSPGKAEERAAEEALAQFGISHLKDRSTGAISGGERQLVLMARAVVQRARVLVLDEPTANLDYGNQIRVMGEISALARKGYTVILSTHNPEHALLYGTKVLALLDTGVLQTGPPAEVLTPALLQKLYRVDVTLAEVAVGDRVVRFCVPPLPCEGGPGDV